MIGDVLLLATDVFVVERSHHIMRTFFSENWLERIAFGSELLPHCAMHAISGCQPRGVAASEYPVARSEIQRTDATAADSRARIRKKVRGYFSVYEVI